MSVPDATCLVLGPEASQGVQHTVYYILNSELSELFRLVPGFPVAISVRRKLVNSFVCDNTNIRT